MALQGRTALVTGFAGAIGSMIATSLANAGCDVIGVDKVKHDVVQMSIDKIKAEQCMFWNHSGIVYYVQL